MPQLSDVSFVMINPSYSPAVSHRVKLKEVFEFEDINELPIPFDIGWYEQKAVAVLLALLSLGVRSCLPARVYTRCSCFQCGLICWCC